MIKKLTLKDFLLIEKLEMNLSDGFNVITGETGAGKTIIIGAINSLFYKNTENELIREGKDFAEITAEIVKENEKKTLRKVITSTEKKLYINNEQKNEFIFDELIDFQGQNEKQILFKKNEQLLLLDKFAGTEDEKELLFEKLKDYKKFYKEYNNFNKIVNDTKNAEDFINFQIKEISNAKIKPEEDKELLEKRITIKEKEKIISAVNEIINMIYDSENSMLGNFIKIQNRNEYLKTKNNIFITLKEKIDEFYVFMKETEMSIRKFADEVSDLNIDIDTVEERLSLIERLKKKYGKTIDDINNKLQELVAKQKNVFEYDDKSREYENKLNSMKDEILKICENLSGKRKQAAKILAKKIEQNLQKMDMKNVKFDINIKNIKINNLIEISANGADEVCFMIAPNIGEGLKPISKIASGGELSRIMLAINIAVKEINKDKTFIFDEVDSGISGNTGFVIGEYLKELSEKNQILVVTHLPQIAIFAKTHFFVEKNVKFNRTYTYVKKLDDKKEKIKEIARMFGDKYTEDIAKTHAEELLKKYEKI